MKIGVTGCLGFIGSWLTERLLQEGHEVYGIDDGSIDYLDEEGQERRLEQLSGYPQFQLIRWNIRHPFSDKKIVLDYVFHLAAKAGVMPSLKNPIDYFQTNLIGTQNILSYMDQIECRKIIFASSSSVYGDVNPPFRENQSLGHPLSPYACSKVACEQLIRIWTRTSNEYPKGAVVLRFFTVFGPRQRNDLALHLFTNKIHNGETITIRGTGKASRCVAFVEDVVDGCLLAVKYLENREESLFEVFNIAGLEEISVLHMVEKLEKALGKKARLQYVSAHHAEVSKTLPCLQRSKELLGYQPSVGFDQGVESFLSWWKEEEQIKKKESN